MVIYVNGLSEPVELDYYTYHTQTPGYCAAWSQMLPGLDSYFNDNDTVWLVPKQTCPECATRRNLADSPGA